MTEVVVRSGAVFLDEPVVEGFFVDQFGRPMTLVRPVLIGEVVEARFSLRLSSRYVGKTPAAMSAAASRIEEAMG